MSDRYANLRRIRTLDPRRDYLSIYQTMLQYEFPWDLRMGLNLAFNRSFSIPEIAALHVATGELIEHTQKRTDDTGLLMYEIMLHGLTHPRGRQALRRMNRIHRAYDITNDDYRYVLGCLVVIPTRWLDRYGWRPVCCHERAAIHAFYAELGRHMGITAIPESYDAFEAWFDDYDREHLRYSPEAARIERATRMLLVNRLPRQFSGLGTMLISSLYDERQRRAVGLADPPAVGRASVYLALKTRAAALRLFGRPRTTPHFAEGLTAASYPDGYDIDDLGPHR